LQKAEDEEDPQKKMRMMMEVKTPHPMRKIGGRE
jgi:hypothetical protein